MGSTCELQRGTCTRVSAGRGSCYACMLRWDPSNCDSRKTLHGPGWKNRCSDGKINMNRETGHLLHILSRFLFQHIKIQLKVSVWHAENKARDKRLLNFELPPWHVLCCQCIPEVFIPTAFFSDLLCSRVEDLIKEMVKGKIQHLNKLSSYLPCGSMLASCTHAYIGAFPLPQSWYSESRAQRGLHLLRRYMSNMRENWESFPPLKYNQCTSWSIWKAKINKTFKKPKLSLEQSYEL